MSQRSKFTIRTSERRVFRRCLRKWSFQSSLKGNWKRSGTEQNINFWFGSAIHFALEDYHGENKFGDPRRAFWAYYQSFPKEEMPAAADGMYSLGISMLSYYLTWYNRHNSVSGYQTARVHKETHQLITADQWKLLPKEEQEQYDYAVEQSFMLPLNYYVVVDVKTDEILEVIDNTKGDQVLPCAVGEEYDYADPNADLNVASRVKIVPICYHGTMDRIVVDKYGRFWVLDYKTAKGADTNKLETDDQISAYLWAFEKWYGFKPYGFVYLQLTKEAVQEPKRLKNKELSVDKRQKTTYSLVKQEIIADYGSVQAAPSKIIEFLNHMATLETPEGDRFIRWDHIKRSPEEIQSTEEHIYEELAQMLNPNLGYYISPTRDCIWDCPLRDWCLATERKDNVAIEQFMKDYEKRPRDEDGNIEPWRENIPWPEKINPGTKEPYGFKPLEDILSYNEAMHIEMDSLAEEEDNTGFKFMYEKDV